MHISTMKSRHAITLAAIFSALIVTGCAEEQVPQDRSRLVMAMKVGAPSALEEQWVPGRAKATRELNLSFRVGGRIIALPVNVGDRLREGDIIAQIDSTDYDVELVRAQSNLEEARAALVAAQANLDRQLRLLQRDSGIVSEADIDRAREARDMAQAATRAQEANLSDARNRVERSTLVAPFDATVVARYADAFEDVQPNQPILRLVDKSQIEFVVNVPEIDISLVPDVTDIRVQFDAFPGLEIPAEVKEIGAEASETTRTYPVTLIMEQPEGQNILPGMAGRAMGEHRDDPRGVTLPLTAVFSSEGGSQARAQGQTPLSQEAQVQPTYVWVINESDMTVARRQVVPDAITTLGVRLKEGVDIGEWVVTAGVYSLQEGQKVRISQQRGE